MTDLIVVAILVVICGAAARYIYKAKKSGAKCIGCAVGEGNCGCSCTSSKNSADSETAGCCCHQETKT